MGIGTIMRSKKILLVVSGEEKVKRLEAVERMIEMVLVGESKNG